ncbi:MAG: hypothetical protein L0Z70_00915, partial [Chloroflexi bacterium]|nr:hypothetical protein [Chloroflexota bacterium]
RLEALHREIGAVYTARLGDDAHPLEQRGNLPGAFAGMALMSALLNAFKSSRQMASLVGGAASSELLWFAGPRYELYIALLGRAPDSPALLSICPASGGFRPRAATAFAQAVAELSAAMPPRPAEQAAAQAASAHPPAALRAEQEQPAAAPQEETPLSPDLEALFAQANAQRPPTGDLNAFWDGLSEDASGANFAGGKAVDYEQARRMGMELEDEA